MSLHKVYITNTATFLPNQPIPNEDMEQYLGLIEGQPSKSRRIVLRSNGITNRHYAINKEGKTTHTNAQLASIAIRGLYNSADELKKIQLIAAGTSTPDQMLPSHAAMVHGWLPETNSVEVVSPSGACCSGMHALKYAYLMVQSGEINEAVAAGSERASGIMRAQVFKAEAQNIAALENNPYIGFEKEFLRWMLSDGAGAFQLSNTPTPNQINLQIDWIEGISFANQLEVCMYMASDKLEDGTLKSFTEYTPEEIIALSILSIKQDVKLLSQNIVVAGFDYLKEVIGKKNLDINSIDYFLPHMSSEFFRSKIAERMQLNNNIIPMEKWFTNLSKVGNIGAGSAYFMVDELFKSGKLRLGQKLLLAVPESARFSYMFCMLTVV